MAHLLACLFELSYEMCLVQTQLARDLVKLELVEINVNWAKSSIQQTQLNQAQVRPLNFWMCDSS